MKPHIIIISLWFPQDYPSLDNLDICLEHKKVNSAENNGERYFNLLAVQGLLFGKQAVIYLFREEKPFDEDPSGVEAAIFEDFVA